MSDIDKQALLRRVHHWIDTLVIGLNLCPFAGRVVRSGLLQISVLETADIAECLEQVLARAQRLNAGDPQGTHILVLAEGFDQFDDYLDLLAMAAELLSMQGLEGQIQIASFHPDYCFEGAEPDDPGNWTNRSPYPLLHLLTEQSVSRAVGAHPDVSSIPQRNAALLRSLGAETIVRTLEADSEKSIDSAAEKR